MKPSKKSGSWFKNIYVPRNIFFFIFLIIGISLILIIKIISAGDILVWQGQYYTGTTFNTGTYEFNFTVYDAPEGGEACFSNITNLTTGGFGEWKTEQYGVSAACNNASKDYYLNINIKGVDQTPRRKLAIWDFLRKNVNETTTGTIQSGTQVVAPVVNAFAQVIAPIIQAIMHVETPKVETIEVVTTNLTASGIVKSDTAVVAPIVNATEVVATNLTIVESGFLSFLGSLTKRTNTLFVKEINVEQSIKIVDTTKGSCDINNEGTIVYDNTGSKREFYGCRQKSVGVYEWALLT